MITVDPQDALDNAIIAAERELARTPDGAVTIARCHLAALLQAARRCGHVTDAPVCELHGEGCDHPFKL